MSHLFRCLCFFICTIFCMSTVYGSEKYSSEKILNSNISLEEKLEYLNSLKDSEDKVLFSNEDIENISDIIVKRLNTDDTSNFEIEGIDEILPIIIEILLKADLNNIDKSSRQEFLMSLLGLASYDKIKTISFELLDKLISKVKEVNFVGVHHSSDNLPTVSNRVSAGPVDPATYLNKYDSNRYHDDTQASEMSLTLGGDIDSKSGGVTGVSIFDEDGRNKILVKLLIELFSDDERNFVEEKIETLYVLLEKWEGSLSSEIIDVFKEALYRDDIDIGLKIKISDSISFKCRYEDVVKFFTKEDIKIIEFLTFYADRSIDKYISQAWRASEDSFYHYIVDKKISFFDTKEEFINLCYRFDKWELLIGYINDNNSTDSIKKIAIKTSLNLLTKTKYFKEFSEGFLEALEIVSNNPKESNELRNIADFILIQVRKSGERILRDSSTRALIFKVFFGEILDDIEIKKELGVDEPIVNDNQEVKVKTDVSSSNVKKYQEKNYDEVAPKGLMIEPEDTEDSEKEQILDEILRSFSLSSSEPSEENINSLIKNLERLIFSTSLSREEIIKSLNDLVQQGVYFLKPTLGVVKKVFDSEDVDIKVKIMVSDIVFFKSRFEDVVEMLEEEDVKAIEFLSFFEISLDKYKYKALSPVKGSMDSRMDEERPLIKGREDLFKLSCRFGLWHRLIGFIESTNVSDDMKKQAIKESLDLLTKLDGKEFMDFSVRFIESLNKISNNPEESHALKNITDFILLKVRESGRMMLQECKCIFYFLF